MAEERTCPRQHSTSSSVHAELVEARPPLDKLGVNGLAIGRVVVRQPIELSTLRLGAAIEELEAARG